MKKTVLTVVWALLVSSVATMVTPAAASAAPASFRAAVSGNSNTTSPSIVVPASVQAGDQLVFVMTANAATTATTPAGWTLLGTRQDGNTDASPSMTSWVFTRTAAADTAGSSVQSSLGTWAKTSRSLVAFAGAVAPADAVSSVLDGASADLTTPEAEVVAAESTVVSYWANKTSGNTGWTLPGSVTSRTTSVGSGGGRITAAVGTSTEDAGTYAGATATSSVANRKGIGWTVVLAPQDPGAGQPPVASFTSSCTLLECTFDAAGSDDPDGSIDSYGWDFGDGETGSGVAPAHTYASAGTYDVRLTVTDDTGMTDSETIEVTAEDPNGEPPAAPASFRAAVSGNSNTTSPSIVVPASVQAGDQLVFVMTANAATTATTPAGWTLLGTRQDGNTDASPSMTSWVFTRTAAADTAGSSVQSSLGTWAKTSRSLVAFAGAVAPADAVSSVLDGASADLTTPEAEVVAAESTVVSYWANKTSGNTGWTLPGSVTSRTTSVGSGGGRITAAVGTSTEDAGTYAGATATSSVANRKGIGWTVVLAPQDPGAGQPPVASFTSSCTLLECTFDAAGSDDPDGSIDSYGWDFGDGETGSGVAPAHTYASAGTYDVRLTVTDDTGMTDSETIEVTAEDPAAGQPPVASFTSSCTLLECTFDAAGSDDPDGSIDSYGWDFGDGETGSGVAPAHTYASAGTYDVTLAVTDDTGMTDSETIEVTAVVPAGVHSQLVPPLPERDQVRITTGEILDLDYLGNRVFIAGTFTSVANNQSGNSTSYSQRYLAAYNINTGLFDTNFRPMFDSSVTEIAISPDGSRLYAVGRFNNVNGVGKRKVVALNPNNGSVVTGFTANANAAATSVAASNSTVYIGGQFSTINNVSRSGLAAVNASNGAVDSGFVNNISGGIGVDGLLTVQALVLTPDRGTLLAVHTGRQIAGQDRYGVGLINTQTKQLLPWRTRLWQDNLSFVGGIQRAYAGAISPDGTYFVVTSGSGGDRPPISDTAIKFPIVGGDNMEPDWVSRAFDSIYSVAISDIAVYMGGHFNYLESPTAPEPWPGLTNVGYGRGQGLSGYGLGDDVLIREHIGAVDPATGKAVEWNPESNSYEGNKAMLVMPRGLVTGGDALTQGGYNIGAIAFYDFNSIEAPGPNETTIDTPIEGRVEEADVEFLAEGTATATTGVQRVQLEVIDRDRNRYLQDDLVTWGSWNAINVDLATPNANATDWSLPLTISGNNRIQLLARTFAVNGSRDATKATKKIETFGLADQTPNTRITGPSTIVPTTTFEIVGTADDDFGINAINISIKDENNRYLQDDGSASPEYNTLRTVPDVVGATSATWSLEVTVPYEGEWSAEAIAVDDAGQSDLRGSTRGWIVSETAEPPTVSITSPAVVNPPVATAPITMEPGAPVTFSGSAVDDEGLREVEIRLRNTTTRENLASDGTWGVDARYAYYRVSPNNIAGSSYNWSYTTPFDLVPGTYQFTVRAVDDLGLSTPSSLRGNLNISVQIPGDAPPDARLDVTGTVTDASSLHLDLTGTATDDVGVASVKLSLYERDVRQYVQPDGTLAADFATHEATLGAPGGTETTFALPIDLPVAGEYDVTAFAYDTAGQQDTSTSGATARYQVYPGNSAPVSNEALFAPAEDASFTEARVVTSGRFEDDEQMAGVQVAIRNADLYYMSSSGAFTSTNESWRSGFLNSPGSPGSNFSYTSPALPDGAYTVFVRGVDQTGLATDPAIERNVTVAGPPDNDPPVAAFSYECEENVCAFDSRASTDENAPTLSYSWDFGQGGGSGPVPTNTYSAPGSYVVTLTAQDEYGLTATATETLEIVEPAGNEPPFAINNPASCVDLTCNFSAYGSEDPNEGDAISYLWDFGDAGTTSTSRQPSHAFAAAGTYTVLVTVTDGWGQSSAAEQVVTVTAPAPG